MEIQNLTKISETCKPYICDKCPTFYFPSQNSALSIVSNFEIFLEDIHMCTFRARTIWEWMLHEPECQTCGCLGFVYFTNPHTCGIEKENHQIPEIRVRKQRNNLANMIGNVSFVILFKCFGGIVAVF